MASIWDRSSMAHWGVGPQEGGAANVGIPPQLAAIASALMQAKMQQNTQLPGGTPANTSMMGGMERPAPARITPEMLARIGSGAEQGAINSVGGAVSRVAPDLGIGSELPRVPPGTSRRELPQVSPRSSQADVPARKGTVSIGPSPLDWLGEGGDASILHTTQLPSTAGPRLVAREGYREDVYPDSSEAKHLTAGIGHRLTPSELERWKEGDIIPRAQIEEWYLQDTQTALRAAQRQARELGVPALVEPLMHVNFQLGSDWHKEHKKTWELLQNDDFAGAAKEAANSDWAKQTPVRVQDFQEALRSLKL